MNAMRLNILLAILACLLFALSLGVGPADLVLAESISGLFAGGGEAAAIIMQEIRLPRALLGLMIGFTLGLSGAVLQGFLRNPLAEPGIIGVSSTAAFGAVLVFYSGLAGSALYALPAGALLGALIAVLALLALSARGGSTLTLILAGVALSSLSGALTSLVLNLSPNPFAAYEIIFWLLGALKDRSMEHVWIAAPLMLLGWVLIAASARAIDALALGEEAAASMGVHLARTRFFIVAGVALGVGAATAVAGTIGFIGLVVPHLIRPLTSNMPSALLLPSALGGAALLLAADIAVRVILPAGELNVGVLTALIGAPFFLWLVARARRDML
ncbi:FecCD family ABC transporter permease [Nitratireductor basaltis]|uniref:Transport system permease protein n=1 Tax=Nitratireductor basaltis TaxID=472175 RepID=A0A084U9K8_9HYPH|nr:iron ABC transporter permease [Nitratireductor basaltis]KFB09644.1 Transport system permease protein precursor [Nitratireductor basaltis]